MSDYLADVNPDNLANVVRALQREVAALKLRDIHGVEKLNEIADILEPLTEFEFRSHLDPEDPHEPGEGFSGVRIAGEGMDYGGNLYAIACVLNDILQAGMNITLGKITAGAEAVFLDENGVSIALPTVLKDINAYKFMDGTNLAAIFSAYKSVTGNMVVGNIIVNGNVNEESGYLALSAINYGSSLESQITLSALTSDDAYINIATTKLTIPAADITIGLSAYSVLNPAGIIYPGTWTPDLFKTINITEATAYLSNYYRIGDKVHFDGVVAIDPTAAGAILLGISLPIASNFTTSLCLNGIAVNVNSEVARLFADSTNKRISLQGVVTGTGGIAWGFHGSYRIVS